MSKKRVSQIFLGFEGKIRNSKGKLIKEEFHSTASGIPQHLQARDLKRNGWTSLKPKYSRG